MLLLGMGITETRVHITLIYLISPSMRILEVMTLLSQTGRGNPQKHLHAFLSVKTWVCLYYITTAFPFAHFFIAYFYLKYKVAALFVL